MAKALSWIQDIVVFIGPWIAVLIGLKINELLISISVWLALAFVAFIINFIFESKEKKQKEPRRFFKDKLDTE